MVTEPSVIKHRLSGIPKHYNSIPMIRDKGPRAAIFTSKTVETQEVSNLGNRDLAVGLIKSGNKHTAIISAYMDIKSNSITQQLKGSCRLLQRKGI